MCACARVRVCACGVLFPCLHDLCTVALVQLCLVLRPCDDLTSQVCDCLPELVANDCPKAVSRYAHTTWCNEHTQCFGCFYFPSCGFFALYGIRLIVLHPDMWIPTHIVGPFDDIPCQIAGVCTQVLSLRVGVLVVSSLFVLATLRLA